ncbi:ABC transporter substrate-binding protein [Roseinatronobacter sp. NSM]|uniref:ABC transporter substrate-binding protein n=1 Tax=Roseinatronobacter sp. NSM TaxID=3457785 RepID=UPI004036BC6C
MRIFHRTLVASAIALCAVPAVHAQELIVGFTRDADTLDPANHRNRETETIIRNIYDGILTRSSDMQIHPEIAESYTQVSPTVYDFTIRSGITFHDGSSLTIEDVKFTLDRIVQEGGMGNGQSSPRASLMGPVESVEILDDTTIRISLSEPWPLLPAMLPHQQIVSRAHVDAVGSDGMATQPMGSGPFRLADWRRGDSVVLERFDDYYGGATGIPEAGPACVERVIFQVIPESASRVAALLSGDVHIINELPPHSMNQVNNSPNAQVMAVNGTRSFFLAMNNQGEIFDDVLVRQAVAHAIDRDLIIDRILGGTATTIDGILSPDAFGKNHDLPSYAYDPDRSRELLAQAGYPDGISITLDTEGALRDTAEAIASLLTNAGITTRVQVGEGTLLTQKWRTQGGAKEGDMYLSSWGNSTLDPFDIFVPTHRTDDRGNSAGYANPELDALLDEAGVELDRDRRAALYQQAEALVNADVPYIYLWVPQDLYGVSTRISNWSPSPDSRINLHRACLN